MRQGILFSIGASCALAAGLLVGVTTPATAAEPAVGECLDLPRTSPWYLPFSLGDSVDCEAPHNSEVFHIAEYPADWGAPSTEIERIKDFSFQFEMCPYQTFNTWLESGGVEPPMISTRLYTNAVPPNDAEWEAGSRAVRCVMYAISGPFGKDLPTAWTGTFFEKVEASGWKEFALCTRKGKPKSGKDLAPFRCRKNNQWVGVARIFDVKGTAGNPYPGPQVQRNADRACVKAVRGFTTGKKVKPYAWLEPKDMWDEGFREAVCYVPLKNWNGTAAN